MLSDVFGLQIALAVTPLFGIAAAGLLVIGLVLSGTSSRPQGRLVDDELAPYLELAPSR